MLGGKVLHDQRKMFISYLSAALLIVLLITAVMYANTTTLVRRQHRESAQETARAQQRLLDRVFLELIMIAQQVEGDAELSDYYVSSAGYGAYQGMTSLRRYLVTNDYLLDVGLLFSDGHLLTAQGSYSLAGYADRFNLPQIQQVYDTWVSERGQTRYRLYAAPQGRALIVAFTQPLIGNPKTRQIVFPLSEKQIDSLFAAAMQDAGSDLALYDREGTLLYHYRDGEPPLADNPSLTVSTETSTVLSLRYAYWYDAQRINDSFSTLNRRFLALLTLAVLAAVALSVVMSVINFRPVRRLLSLVPGESLEQVARLDELQDYLAGVMARNLRQAQQLQSYTALTRNYALEQVLLGRGGEEQLRGLLQSGSIAFSFGYYTVFRFLPASFRAEDSAQSYQPSSRAEALTRICQAAQPFGQPAGLEWHDASLVLLLCHPGPFLDSQAVFESVCAAVQPIAAVSGGCGHTVSSLEATQYSLNEAISASELAHFSLRPFMDASRYETAVLSDQTLHLPVEQALVDAVRANDRALIAQLIGRCQQEWLERRADIVCLRVQSMGLVNRLTALLENQHAEGFAELVQEMLGSTTMTAHFQALESICSAAADVLGASAAAENDPQLARILRCMEENHANPALNVQWVADRLSMSASYLTRYLREHMNTTPSKYIEKVRMQHAQQLLRDTRLQIKEIVPLIGYNDVSSFVRKFKGETGYTPLQYRNLSQPGGQSADTESQAEI